MAKVLCAVVTLLLLGACVAQAQGPNSMPAFYTLPNDTTTGTTQFTLSKIVNGRLVRAATTDTSDNLYVCYAGCGTTGSALFVVVGEVTCVMDQTVGSGASNRFVVVSPTTAGQCRSQASPPSNGMVVGRMVDDATTTGQPALILAQNQPYIPGSGTGTGTLQNVALVMPGEFSVAGSPVSGTGGTFTVTEAAQAQNSVYAGPTSGSGAPGFRALVAADIPGTASGTCAGDLTGTYPNCVVSQASTTFALPGESSQTLAGAANDYALCTTPTCNLNGGASDRDVTGFAAQPVGRLMEVCNTGTSNNLVLKQESTLSSVNNRLQLSGDMTLIPGVCQALRYHSTNRWRAIAGTVPDYLKVRSLGTIVGDPGSSSPPLQADNDSPGALLNDYERPLVIKTVACFANGPSLVMRVILTGQSATSVLTGDCTCGDNAWAACSVQGTTPGPTLNSFSGTGVTCTQPCTADVLIMTVPATNGPKYMVVKVKGVLQ